MALEQNSILKRIRSAQTWDRADWWIRRKGGAEAKEARGIIKPEDYLPITLGFLKGFTMVLPMCILLWLSWKINLIMFYIILGISIPVSLGVAHLINYLIRKYIATEK